MRSIKVADNRGHLDGLGTVLIALREAEHSIKADLLNQVVSIIRRRKGTDECVQEIATLMRVRKMSND
jgi:hypothetical protein